MALKKHDMKPGQKYKGYAILNEYGEIQFIPEDKGSREGNYRIICDNPSDNYSIAETKHLVRIVFRLKKKGGPRAILQTFISATTKAIVKLQHYDFQI